ncbi:hypothetical protein [Thalassospira alkalitolerans]|uniref:hypothetical protein n=1 Tax=Thalassospira alkalitolerans TaxID=1293890 RepID=UPI003AA94C0A
MKAILYEDGASDIEPVYETFNGNVRVLAYPEQVAMAILEYFALDSTRLGQPVALRNFRRIARHGLREFVYGRTGYTGGRKDDVWAIFRDRVSLNFDSVPDGYFGIFKEISSLIVNLGLQGLHIDERFVPDISVGQAWAKHWTASKFKDRFGDRRTYPHNYPPYFPQAVSNPQMAACYPEDALGEFRRWFRNDYIGEGRFKKYLTGKASELQLEDGYVERAMLALTKGE